MLAGVQGNVDAGVLARMSDAIAHRGPDGCGTFHRPEHGIGLAHRRLAIIDLSHAADQPMCDDAAGLAIVFNGEIYNYRELRAELVQDGYAFRTQSDTEVLLRLYTRDGEAMLPRLNGNYAFAIWDTGKRELFLARDGLGVKPLYYMRRPRRASCSPARSRRCCRSRWCPGGLIPSPWRTT